MQPQVLVSYKTGYLGTEDIMAPERNWDGALDKPLEICNTLQGYSLGYDRAELVSFALSLITLRWQELKDARAPANSRFMNLLFLPHRRTAPVFFRGRW